MPVTIDGTTGVTTPGATVGAITGILKATSGVVSQAVAGSDYGQLTIATAQTATGTAVDFTGIPSWAKRMTVMFNGLSTNGASIPIIQLGDSGGVETTGYVGGAGYFNNAGATSVSTISAGFQLISTGHNPAPLYYGQVIISLMGSNTWVATGNLSLGSDTNLLTLTGTKTLSATLDRIRITTVNGTDTFDAGTINISYE